MSKLSEYLLLIIGIFALMGIGFYAGFHTEYKFAMADKEKAEKALAQEQVRLSNKTDKIITKYVYRTRIIHDRAQKIIQKVKVYVPTDYIVPLGLVRVLNGAASGSMPKATSASDANPSGVTLDTVAGITIQNYDICQETTEQLIGLQQWARNVSNTN